MGRAHVFISYAREDAVFVRKLSKRLSNTGLASWQDISGLRGSQDWQRDVDKALRSAFALVVVMSRYATRSRYVTYEWAFALGAGIPVVWIRRSATQVHPRLALVQCVDFTKRGKTWLRLIDAVQAATAAEQEGDSPGYEPTLRAKFRLDNGRVERVEDEYVIDLWLDGIPTGATSVRYEIHDEGETFDEPVWIQRNPGAGFATQIQSYGDVLISAKIRRGPGRTTDIEKTLFQALKSTHGDSSSKAVLKALRNIEQS